MNNFTNKTFNPENIEQKAFLIQKGMTFFLRDEKVTVLAAGQDFTVLDHGNGQKSYPHPQELVSAYKNGLLIFKVKENAVLANKQLTREKDKLKAKHLEPLLWSLHERANKHSLRTLKSVIKSANLPEEFKISPSTLRRNYKTFIENDMDIFPVIKKPKKTRAKRHDMEVIELAEQVIDEHYLVPAGLSKRQTYFKFVELFEEAIQSKESSINHDTTIISESRFYEMLNELNEVDVTYARKGKDEARKFARQSHGQYVLDFPLQRVEIDALHLNLGLLDEDGNFLGTVIVYLAIDCFTRCIVGYSLSFGTSVAEKSEAVIELLKHCISPKSKSPLAENDWPLTGVPFAFFGDAGKAFNCREVKHFAAQIKCNYITTATKSPWKKAFIEALNRSIRGFARLLPGYSRNNDEDRNEKGVEELATLTLGDFINLLEMFILDYYHQNPHRGLYGNTPANECEEALKSCSPRIVPDLSKLDLIGGFEHTGTIQGCAGIQKNNLFYQSKALNDLRLELHKAGDKGNPKVPFLYSAKDISKITVINELTGELLPVPCTHPLVQTGMNLETFRRKTNKPLRKGQKQKVYPQGNAVVTEAMRMKAYRKLEKQRAASSKPKDQSKQPSVSNLEQHAKEHIKKQQGRSARNYTDHTVAQMEQRKVSLTRPQTN